jgi:cobalt/nickel transport system permease protein
MVLTPLGILAAGTAWGEWSSADFANSRVPAKTESAAGPVPSSAPAGLQKLSALWTAPFPGYAPRFIKSQGFGYLLSAMFGVGFLALASLVVKSVVRRKCLPEARA